MAGIGSAADELLAAALGVGSLDSITPGSVRSRELGFVLVVGRPPVGFVHVLEEAGGHAHLEQVAVHPDAGRRGIGTALVEAACATAVEHGREIMTLTTFCDVPFNGPFYERFGFRIVDRPTGDLARHLAREREVERLDDLGVRVAMVRRLR